MVNKELCGSGGAGEGRRKNNHEKINNENYSEIEKPMNCEIIAQKKKNKKMGFPFRGLFQKYVV